MKKYLTSVIAIHNVEGKLGKWPGPIIEAESFEAAQEWCLKNTQYLFVEQEIMEARKEDHTDFQLNWPNQLATNCSHFFALYPICQLLFTKIFSSLIIR